MFPGLFEELMARGTSPNIYIFGVIKYQLYCMWIYVFNLLIIIRIAGAYRAEIEV